MLDIRALIPMPACSSIDIDARLFALIPMLDSNIDAGAPSLEYQYLQSVSPKPDPIQNNKIGQLIVYSLANIFKHRPEAARASATAIA